MSAYNCSPEGNTLQNPQTLFSLAYFSTYAAACIAAPYLCAQRSSWIAQTEKNNKIKLIFEFRSKFGGHLHCNAIILMHSRFICAKKF